MLATLSPEPGLRPQAASASLGPQADEVSFSRLIFVFRKVGRSKLGCSASEWRGPAFFLIRKSPNYGAWRPVHHQVVLFPFSWWRTDSEAFNYLSLSRFTSLYSVVVSDFQVAHRVAFLFSLLKDFIYFYACECLLACMYVCTPRACVRAWCPWKPEEGIESSGTRVIDGPNLSSLWPQHVFSILSLLPTPVP